MLHPNSKSNLKYLLSSSGSKMSKPSILQWEIFCWIPSRLLFVSPQCTSHTMSNSVLFQSISRISSRKSRISFRRSLAPSWILSLTSFCWSEIGSAWGRTQCEESKYAGWWPQIFIGVDCSSYYSTGAITGRYDRPVRMFIILWGFCIL